MAKLAQSQAEKLLQSINYSVPNFKSINQKKERKQMYTPSKLLKKIHFDINRLSQEFVHNSDLYPLYLSPSLSSSPSHPRKIAYIEYSPTCTL